MGFPFSPALLVQRGLIPKRSSCCAVERGYLGMYIHTYILTYMGYPMMRAHVAIYESHCKYIEYTNNLRLRRSGCIN